MAAPANQPVIRAVSSAESGTLALLLQYEADLRRAASVNELVYHVANETRRILPYDQMFVLRRAHVGDGFRVLAASSIAVVDRNAPMIRAVEAVAADWVRGEDSGQARRVDIRSLTVEGLEPLADYPFHHWLWQPLTDPDGKVFGGLIAAFASPPGENEAVRLERVGETAAHGWRALTRGQPVRRIAKPDKRQKWAIAIVVATIMVFPVRMSALAPAEVVAVRPFVISAPFDGVIEEVAVPPYTLVRKGQLLVRFDDVRLRNELELTQERLAVARARVERASSAAFADTSNESRDVAIMRAEYQEAEAAHAYARDLLARSRLTSPRDGIAIYTDRREWEGRAVTVGQPVMQIADPKAVELRIDLPAREQMTLVPGSPVRLWLDSQPLWALDGQLARISYQAQPTAGGVLAFSLTAKLRGETPPIGSRGTARVSGRWVPLAYSVLKRPIASLRQTIGI
jgi:multidrug resistance efflux pump